MEVIL